jgi:hypothetical protein
VSRRSSALDAALTASPVVAVAAAAYGLGAASGWAMTGRFRLPWALVGFVVSLGVELVLASFASWHWAWRLAPVPVAVGALASAAVWSWYAIPPLLAYLLVVAPRVVLADAEGRTIARRLATLPLLGYIVMAVSVAIGTAPVWTLGVIFTLPLAWWAVRERDPAVWHSLLIELTVAFAALLAAGYVVKGIVR